MWRCVYTMYDMISTCKWTAVSTAPLRLPKRRYSIMVRQGGRQVPTLSLATDTQGESSCEWTTVTEECVVHCRMTLMNDLPPLISYYSAWLFMCSCVCSEMCSSVTSAVQFFCANIDSKTPKKKKKKRKGTETITAAGNDCWCRKFAWHPSRARLRRYWRGWGRRRLQQHRRRFAASHQKYAALASKVSSEVIQRRLIWSGDALGPGLS